MNSTLYTTRYRLRSGYHFVPHRGAWLLYWPDGRFARLKVNPDLTQAVVVSLAGEEAPLDGVSQGEFETFLESLLAEGVVAPEAAGDGRTEPEIPLRRRVMIEGEEGVASLLIELLLAGGLEPRLVSSTDLLEGAAGTPASSDLMVCCAGWLPDAHFQARDAWCAEQGVAWHGLYAEGSRFHLGPFWLPDDPSTVRYADARARRLAADAHPDGLEAYWSYLDSGLYVPPFTPPNPAEAALLAGALAADILAWSAGSTPPSHGHQLAYDRSGGHWRRHPVLPVPRGLMTEEIS